MPNLFSTANSWPWAELPCATPMVFPLSCAGCWIGESPGTRIASPGPVCCPACTMAILALAAAEKIGGVLPTPPMSIAPALAASSSGGPEVNVDHSILYEVPSSNPAACSNACEPPFWSPTLSTTWPPDAAAAPPPQPASASADTASRGNRALRSFIDGHSQVGEHTGPQVGQVGVPA